MGNLGSMIEGSDFEKNLDAMLERMEASGMSEEDMWKEMTSGMGEQTNSKTGEINFDPSTFNIDPNLAKDFDSLMQSKKDSGEIDKLRQQMLK